MKWDMNTKRHYASFLTFVLVLTSCNFPSLEPATETPLTLLPIPVTPETVTESPPTGEPPAPQIADFSPVIYRNDPQITSFILLGGVDRDAWYSSEATVSRLPGRLSYDVYGMTGGAYSTSGEGETDRLCNAHFIIPETVIDDSGLVGALQGWQVTRRNVEELDSEGGFYRQVVTDWLASEGVPAPQIDSMQVFRVDIEGDGVDEVFIGAHHFVDGSGHMTQAGDYSVVLMRKVNGNDVVTLAITGKIYTSAQPELTFPFTYSFSNFIDLNQDGILEVVVDLKRWEGLGASVYQINGQEIVQVLSAVCTL